MHRKQPEKYKQNTDVAPPGKISADAHECAFHYWGEQNSKVLSQMAWIVFAVAMTQMSVEKLFSGVKFILSGLRNSLEEDNLQATILQRTNM